MSNDAELDAVEKRLKEYVLQLLADPRGSPVLNDFKAAMNAAIQQDLKPFVASAEALLTEIKSDLPGRVGRRLDKVETALDDLSHRIERMDQLLEQFGASSGVEPRQRAMPVKRRPKKQGWLVPILIAAAVLAGLLYLLIPLGPNAQQQSGNGAISNGAAVQVPPPSQREASVIDRGWERVLAHRSADREELCGQRTNCGLDNLEDVDRSRAMQAAMDTLHTEFSCGGDALTVDGDIGRQSVAAFRNVAQCLERSNDPRCADNACRAPPGDEIERNPATWNGLNWALTILGATERAGEETGQPGER
jgi:hypothetical protein